MSDKKSNFLLRSFRPNSYGSNKKTITNTFRLANVGVNWNNELIKSSLSDGVSKTNGQNEGGQYGSSSSDFYDSMYSRTQDITKLNVNHVAFFDQDYSSRRDYLRNFSQNGEISTVLEQIADETIIPDDNNYFLHVDLSHLKSRLKKTDETKTVLDGITEAFNRVYEMYGWADGDDAWSYVKKFLVDGFLAFEILFDYNRNPDGTLCRDDDGNVRAKDIIGFKEIDPVTLEPDIVKDEISGQDLKVWYQYKDDSEKERIIPDSHIVYISWQKGNFDGRISYLEGLTRTFNMLRQLENSRIIWNIQNAQKRIKMVVPISTSAPDRAKARLEQLKAYYNEDVQIDSLSGEVTVNGQADFSFNHTYVFPSKEGTQTEISEMGVEGYDMNSTEQLKYWWRRFILESHVPANRFTLDPASGQSSALTGESTVTREEYTYSRFIKRVRFIFKQIIIKPMWIQFCLKFPAFANSEQIKSLIRVSYNEENQFELAKERETVNSGVDTVNNLAQMKCADGSPKFSIDFLITKYLGMTEDDLRSNEEYLLNDKKAEIESAYDQQQNTQQQSNAGGGMDAGSASPFDGGGMTDGGMGAADGGMGTQPDMSGGMTDGGMSATQPAPQQDMSGGMA